MDCGLDMTSGRPEMTWDPVSGIRNNVLLSILIVRGTWWFDLDFGMRPLPKKNTLRTERLAEEYAREALQWLLDLGRATSIEITAQRIADKPNGMQFSGVVTATDGEPVAFSVFKEVV